MLDEPRMTQSTAQRSAVIRFTIPREKIREVMGAGISELLGVIAAQGIAPAGPLYSHHLRMDPKVFDFEIGVPVARPVSPAGRVEEGELPGARVVQAVYRGSYEGLPSAWGEFDAWIAEQGYSTGPNLWERYLAGPESGPDPATWRTELNRPVTG